MKTIKTLFPLVILIAILGSCNKNSPKVVANHLPKTDTITQKDGRILSYSAFQRPLIKMKRDKTVYHEAYLRRIDKLVEYYFDKSVLPNVLFQLGNPNSKLGYSIEETEWEGVVYTQIGLFIRPEKNIKTFQWLFYDAKTQKLYEFDVPKNQPILFQFK